MHHAQTTCVHNSTIYMIYTNMMYTLCKPMYYGMLYTGVHV